MAGYGLVNIALDGVDKVGKTAICLEIEKQYGIPRLSADAIRVAVPKLPLEVRIWGDVPILGAITVLNKTCVLDRSIISVLAYNYSNKDIFDKLFAFIDWYQRHALFVFNTFRNVETVLKRGPGIEKDALLEQDNAFRKVYERIGALPLVVYAEDSIESKVNKIMEVHNLHSNWC